jgi:hypothetical protein
MPSSRKPILPKAATGASRDRIWPEDRAVRDPAPPARSKRPRVADARARAAVAIHVI